MSRRSSNRNERTLTYGDPAKLPRIDARATQRDISGNVISEPGEKAFTDIHRGMSGEPLSGKSIATGSYVNFPQPGANKAAPGGAGGTTSAGTAASESGAGRFPQARQPDPGSAMKTGNAKVPFQSPTQRGDSMAEENNDRVDGVADAAAARMPAPSTSPAANITRLSTDDAGRSTGYVADRGDGTRDLSSIYGSGQATTGFPQQGSDSIAAGPSSRPAASGPGNAPTPPAAPIAAASANTGAGGPSGPPGATGGPSAGSMPKPVAGYNPPTGGSSLSAESESTSSQMSTAFPQPPAPKPPLLPASEAGAGGGGSTDDD